jgi:hypothetical protein
MTETTHETKPVPSWIHDMEFCHIACDDEGIYTYCGDGDGDPVTCSPGYYAGEAICPNCGHPTCPRCAQLADLDDRVS